MQGYILIIICLLGCSGNTTVIDTPTTQTHTEINLVTTTTQQTNYLINRVIPNILLLPNDVPKSVIAAQALLESGNGTSNVVMRCNNHFGHRTSKGYIKYESDSIAFTNHYKLLKSKYNPNSNDWVVWCNKLGNSNYSESTDYGIVLNNIIKKYKLYELDRI